MSQKTRATSASGTSPSVVCPCPCQGRSWKVLASGQARTSLSWTLLKPSIADPSNVMPSSSAFSSSAGVIEKVLGVPSTSVNQSCTNRMPRSSTVRRTYSSWLLITPGTSSGTSGSRSRSTWSIRSLSQGRRALVEPWPGRGRAVPSVAGRSGGTRRRRRSPPRAARCPCPSPALPAQPEATASPQTVSIMTAVTWYGSMLALGRRSSSHPCLFFAVPQGIRIDAPRSEVP